VATPFVDELELFRTEEEVILIPHVTACVMAHAPIGSSSGVAAPLGFASFDPGVLDRVQSLILDTTIRYVQDQRLRSEIEQGIERPVDAGPWTSGRPVTDAWRVHAALCMGGLPSSCRGVVDLIVNRYARLLGIRGTRLID